jgi:hypothetical protein
MDRLTQANYERLLKLSSCQYEFPFGDRMAELS